MRKVKKFFALAILLVAGCICLPQSVYGGSVQISPTLSLGEDDCDGVAQYVDAVEQTRFENEKVYGGYELLGFDKGDITFNFTEYNTLTMEQKENTMRLYLDSVQNSKDISRINKTKIYNFIADADSATASLVRQLSEDVDADFISAYSSFKHIGRLISFVLGFLTLLIFALLGLMMVIDLAYIVIPGVQIWLSKGNESVKPKFISNEAWAAVKESEKSVGNGYRDAVGVYFHLKSKQLMMMGVCILYLVSGQLYGLLANFIDLFNGLLK